MDASTAITATADGHTDLSIGSTRSRGLSYGFAKRHGVLVEEHTESHICLVHRADVTSAALLEARRALGKPLLLKGVTDDTFNALLTRRYESDSGQAMDVMDDLGDEFDLNRLAESMPEPEDLMESEDDAPVIRLINAMLTEATRKNASDIHIEPFEKRLNIRFRVDGVMQELLEPPRAIAPLIISRIKVMAKLDIAEKRLPQDGRISLRVAGRPVDVRVSTLPSGHGERVVLRLLDKQAGRLNLQHLGMADESRQHLDQILKMPHGIMLVTGPTGSGKTTSLYAAITQLNNSRSTILTVEDPIEYYLDGIGQTQVNTKVELDFARGLRAILRQDPDVVMVGEIRDLETAEIAVQASLTGHMVLSTLHTNSAVGAVTRLRDMGVEPFLLSSSLVGLVAQRLVRLLCQHCRQAHTPGAKECEALAIDSVDSSSPMIVYTPKGCDQCGYTGYMGRTGIYEVVPVNEVMRGLIHDGASESELEQHAHSYTSSINDDARRRVLLGETSLEEVLRVTRDV